MQQTVRIILFTTNESAAPELRRILTSLPQIRIVAELDEPSLLSHATARFPADLIVADLEPNSAVVLECLRQLKESSPLLPIFGLGQSTQGDFLLSVMRAGLKEYFPQPLKESDFQEAIGRLAVSPTTPVRTREPGKLISVMGTAGGVGCTTIATNLAVELADLVAADAVKTPQEETPMVAVVDLDFRFGHVATLLDLQGQFTIADLAATPEQLDPQMITKAMIRHECGVYCLRRPHQFAQAELITAAHCANVLSSLQEMCRYVIVDGPTRHDPGGRSVLDAADLNLFILQLLVTSVRNADRMCQELVAQGFNADRMSFVVNRLGRDSGNLELAQVEGILKRKVMTTIADDWATVSAAINIGQPLKTEATRSKVRLDIRRLAQMIHCPQELAANADRKGLLNKFFKKTNKTPPPDVAATPAVAGA